MAVDEVECGGVTLGRVGEAGEDVPRRGDEEEDGQRGPGVEPLEAEPGAGDAVRAEQIEEDDGDGEDEADEAFAEDVEGAGGGEEVAAARRT